MSGCYTSMATSKGKVLSDTDYILFLIASPKDVSCTEASRCSPNPDRPAHDSFYRLLESLSTDTSTLWHEAKTMVDKTGGALVLDDSTLDKLYAQKSGLVTHHWSGKHRAVVKGINLLTMLWTDGDAKIPCDLRLYDTSGKTKNDHFRDMLDEAKRREMSPRFVLFDGWYSSLENLKHIRDLNWHWLTRFKDNRQVAPGDHRNVPLSSLDIPADGLEVHLRGYGFIRVFVATNPDGEKEYWATNDLTMNEKKRQKWAAASWAIEVYHRGLKQACNVERCQARRTSVQRGHILASVRAFLRLEWVRLKEEVSWYETKRSIVREAIRTFLANPSVPRHLALGA